MSSSCRPKKALRRGSVQLTHIGPFVRSFVRSASFLLLLSQLYQKTATSEFLGGVDIGDSASSIKRKQYRGLGGAIFDGICVTGLDGDMHSDAAGEVREVRTFDLRVPSKSPVNVESVYDQLIDAQLRFRTNAAMKDTFARFATAPPTDEHTGEDSASLAPREPAPSLDAPAWDADDDAARKVLQALGGTPLFASPPAQPPLPEGEPPVRRSFIIDGDADAAPGAPKSAPPTPRMSATGTQPLRSSGEAPADAPAEAPVQAPADARQSTRDWRGTRMSRGPAPGPPPIPPPEVPWKPPRGSAAPRGKIDAPSRENGERESARHVAGTPGDSTSSGLNRSDLVPLGAVSASTSLAERR